MKRSPLKKKETVLTRTVESILPILPSTIAKNIGLLAASAYVVLVFMSAAQILCIAPHSQILVMLSSFSLVLFLLLGIIVSPNPFMHYLT